MSALAHALRLACIGIPAFACNSDKRPVTRHGFRDASTDPATLRAMFSKPGAALAAVPTGMASGIVVVDGDVKAEADGVATLRQWIQTGRLARTRVHATRRGGVHLLYRHDPARALRCTVGALAPAVDTRGDGGYVVWWPASGGAVLRDMPLAGLPVLPGWVADAAAYEPPRALMPRLDPTLSAEARLAAVVRKVASAANGERNSLLYWGARRCAEMVTAGVLHNAAARAVLAEAASHAGLSDREAEPTIRSGLGGSATDGR